MTRAILATLRLFVLALLFVAALPFALARLLWRCSGVLTVAIDGALFG